MGSGSRFASACLHRAALAAGAATLGCWAAAASAGSIYACRDPDGRAYTADRPIAECARTPLRELRSDGSVRREIAAPLTPEQARQREAQAQQRLAEEAAQRERLQRDRALLMAYPTEARLEQQRLRVLDRLRREIDEALGRIRVQQQQLEAAQAQLDAAVRRRQPASPELAQQAEQAAGAMLVDESVVRSKREEMARMQAKFDEERERLKQLLGAERAAPARTVDIR